MKLYVYEPGSEFMVRLAAQAGRARLSVLTLTAVELRSAVRRRQRVGDYTDAVADKLLRQFAVHLSRGVFVRQPLTDIVLDSAMDLLDRHPLRAADAIQLAGCAVLKLAALNPIFVCADVELVSAAAAEGLAVINPQFVP